MEAHLRLVEDGHGFAVVVGHEGDQRLHCERGRSGVRADELAEALEMADEEAEGVGLAASRLGED